MKKTLTFLLVSTTLTAAVGVPSWAAVQSMATSREHDPNALADDAVAGGSLILASADEDEDDDHGRGFLSKFRMGHDDDDEDDDDDDDDDDSYGSAQSPAPAGSVAPPQNGLFGNGAPPKVQMN
ncbi:hypothetical protein [Chachezhania sediminis]|uniref:hypothetical protein n=1 Tax=Chachezhania sediminis TaxID=2599291 RepID=UPI00131D04BD|nr:hypothetical protein [Chachezhania sediminis]